MATKPTQTNTSLFPELDDLDDLFNPSPTSPLAKTNPEPEHHHKTQKGDPELRRASGAETRASTAGIGLPGHMRDLLNRLPNELGAGEIDDAEAARRAGLTPRHDDEVRPRPPGTDVVTRQNLPDAVKNTVQVAGVRNPKWHTINNLPGYMARAIRAMGRGMFDMITSTPLEDIQTIANVNGQGPNSEEELRAVAGWLRDNAEEVRTLDFDYSQLMPGYDPEVKEYRTDGIRFHVVRDEMGHYIYAYPEQDAKEPGEGPRGLGQDRRRLPGPRNESKENKVYNPADEIRRNIALLESIQEEVDDATELDELMEELTALEAYRGKASKARYMDPEKQKERMSRHSTLGPLLSKEPGGPQLISWLHKEMGLGAKADWSVARANQYSAATMPSVPQPSDKTISGKWGSGIWADEVKDARVMWQIIKSNPDNFIIFVGPEGCGGVRPKQGYIEGKQRDPNYNPSADDSLPYRYAFFNQGGSITLSPNTEAFLRGQPVTYQAKDKKTGEIKTKQSTRGGRPFHREEPPNLLDAVKDSIGGKIKRSYAAYPAPEGEEGPSVEREKIAQRAAAKGTAPDQRSVMELSAAIWKKISPVVEKIANKTVLKINNKAKRLIDAGNFEGATKVSRAGEQLRQFLVALDQSGGASVMPQQYAGTFSNVLKVACREFGGDWTNQDEFKQFLASALTTGEELKFILDTFRSQLGGSDVNPYAE